MSMSLPDLKGQNHAYLEGRGIDADHAGLYGLRFSLFGTHNYLNEKGEPMKQSFANRIIFPVWNLDGTMVTFQGRDVTGTSDTRYKFAGGLPGTGRYLYNGHTARGLRAKHVVMNEGPTDVIKTDIALKQTPDLNHIVPVGSFGMNLSKTKAGDDQVGAFSKLKREGLERVTILWDGEAEAFDAALDAAALLIKVGLTVFVAKLPRLTPDEKARGVKSHDPGSVDAIVVQRAVREAEEVTRLSLLRMRMNNPYRDR
jgi:DNA primase